MCPLSNANYCFTSPLHQDWVFSHRPCYVAPVKLKSREVNSTVGQAVSSPWSDAESNPGHEKEPLQILLPGYYEVPNEMSCENVFHSHMVMGWYYCMETIKRQFSYKIKGGDSVNKTSNLFEKKNGMEFSLVIRLKDSLEGQKEKSLWVQIYFHPDSVLQWKGNSFEIRFFGVEILILPFSRGMTLEQMTPCLGIQSTHLWKDLPEQSCVETMGIDRQNTSQQFGPRKW